MAGGISDKELEKHLPTPSTAEKMLQQLLISKI
jgi:hypothetical protein